MRLDTYTAEYEAMRTATMSVKSVAGGDDCSGHHPTATDSSVKRNPGAARKTGVPGLGR
jgi:hypothetical protein